jgi:hypothetical protein
MLLRQALLSDCAYLPSTWPVLETAVMANRFAGIIAGLEWSLHEFPAD